MIWILVVLNLGIAALALSLGRTIQGLNRDLASLMEQLRGDDD
ncbi:MAG TPA: hypothetical protein VM537_17430 [Anaerolineae bacterium]|nr:hypothetical protein [Anaerolineae bacterium]